MSMYVYIVGDGENAIRIECIPSMYRDIRAMANR